MFTNSSPRGLGRTLVLLTAIAILGSSPVPAMATTDPKWIAFQDQKAAQKNECRTGEVRNRSQFMSVDLTELFRVIGWTGSCVDGKGRFNIDDGDIREKVDEWLKAKVVSQ